MNVFSRSVLVAVILLLSRLSAQACSPLNVPTLVSQNVTGCNLNLNWSSNTIYNCQYYIQVELICNSATFLGNGNPPFYVSATINKTSTPFAYPVQTINICNLCPGTVYKFRAREVYATFPATTSAWTATYTFTTPGTFVQPTVNVTANPTMICVPQTSQLNATISNPCGPTAPTYSWVPASSLNNPTIQNPVASPTATTTYTCYVTGGQQGCWSANNSVTVTSTVPPVAGTASVAPATICAGNTVTLTLTGYTGTIQWQSGPTSSGPWTNIPGATTTPYVTAPLTANTCFQAVVSGCGTVASNAVCVTVNPAPIANAGANAQICLGQSTTLNGSGGGTYSWAPGGSLSSTTAANPVATPTVTTVYTLTVTQVGCTSTANVTVTVNPVQTLSVAPVNPTCSCNGTITVTATGGNGPYTYSWSTTPSQNTATATGLCAGTYSVLVTSANGCTATISATLTQPPSLNVSIPASSNVTCFNLCDGSATVNVTGGTAPYNYSWVPAGSGPNPTNLCAGNYTVYVTDANGCSGSATLTITQPPQLTLSTAGFAVSCFGACNGQGVVIPGGGTLPYSYSWSPTGGNAPSATGLCAGIYTVCVTDANACSACDTAVVSSPSQLALSMSATASTCGQPNGSATVNVSGGTGPYAYSWVPSGGNAATANGLVPNTYCVYVTDANNCTDSACVVVPNTAGPSASIASAVNPTCFGSCNGSVTVNVVNGLPPYTYAWAPAGGNAATGTGLCAGTSYTCTVTDANNCTDTVMITLTQPAQLAVTPGPPVTICIGASTTLTATGSGGTPAYNFSWAPAGPTVSPGVTTVYTVFITDANGCTGTPQTVTVTVNPPLNVIASNPVSICVGATAQLSAIGSGGNGGPYTYNWLPGPMAGQSVTVNPPVTTTYTVIVSDNCGTPSDSATVTVTVNPLPVVTFTGTDTTGCVPLTVTFTNNTSGSAACSWNFGDGATSSSCGPVTHTYTTPGTYTVFLQVTDNNGCVASSTHTNMVAVYGQPVSCFTFGPQPTTILDGTISFTDCSTGGTNWTWSFGDLANSTSYQQNPQFTYNDTGSFTVQQVVCNSNGCCDSSMQTVVIGPDFTLYVPNAFTPDGDGNNDTFFPKGEGFDINSYRLWIFDRWGNLLFFNDNWNKHWDGKVEGGSGEIVQEDVYVWKIEINDYLGAKHQYVGHVSVIK
ncbi:MAG: PKD domain-containing protein [Bacteroidota bacterium]